MEEQGSVELGELLSQLQELEPEGHATGKDYPLNSRILTLRCVLNLEQGDKDHKMMGRTQAVARASSLLEVSPASIYNWLRALKEGVLGDDVMRGRPECIHHVQS